jgi:hypothetical protein
VARVATEAFLALAGVAVVAPSEVARARAAMEATVLVVSFAS